MEFSRAQFEAVLNEITTNLDEFAGNLERFVPVAAAAVDHWYVAPAVKSTVMDLAHKSVSAGREILAYLRDLLKGAVAPVHLYFDSLDWSEIRGQATLVGSCLTDNNLHIDDGDWSGKARDAYGKAAAAQAAAVTRVGAISSAASNALTVCAAGGALFYAGLLAVTVKLVVASVTAIAALGSVVFSRVGVGLILEEAGVNTAFLVTAVGALLGLLTVQAGTLASLAGEAADVTSFPAGRWPRSDSKTYNDATVTDGDADWSLR